MAQLQPTTTSTTSTAGFEWINKPVEPENIVRYFCDASIRIDGCDRNLYPAICFNLINKANQYWVYPNKDARDADCEAIADEVGPPPSDYLAYWDITGDGLPDTGTGSGPIAIYLGGVSGTHEADQLYFDETGVPTALPSPFDGILQMRTSGSPYVLADFDGADGTSLGLGSSWSGPFAVDAAANMLGTVGHTSLMQFSKLPFAVSNNLTYARALTYLIKIKARKSGLLSGNTGNILEMPVNTSVGLLDFPSDIDVRNYAGKIGSFVHVSLYNAENGADQGVVDIQDTAARWSKNSIKTDTGETLGGTIARYFADSGSPSGFSVVWAQSLSTAPQRLNLYRSTIVKFGVDGFPRYGLAQNINGPGVVGSQTVQWNGIAVIEALGSGGMPAIVICKGPSTKTSSIMSNTGTTAVPDYSLNPLRTDSIESSIEGITLPRADAAGKLYMPRGTSGPIGQLSRLTYSGANGNAAALVTVGNWGFERLGDAATSSPAADGDGSTFTGRPYGVAINEDDLVNAEPTIYVTDDLNHVLWEVTRNANAFGDERDWDWAVIVGQTGVAGNVDGVGTLATLNEPRGIDYEAGFLYISNRGSHTVRRVNTSTLLVDTYFGTAGTPGTNMQFDF
jgi:hypothetical protein